ncbi:hypothetical protein ACJRO7_027647 [Eucalyptus globulus]|uniref:1-acylglycerol-3-phosphate O-acyltransferase n=1 Tax=Eucalyptus globulus TaxID=34317 RepID=A0ABD3JT44_EUCGL
MKSCEPSTSADGKGHASLTLPKVVRGIVCLSVLLLTAFMMLVYLGFLTAVPLRFFSVHYSRKAISFFFGIWLAFYFCGETVPPRERVLLIANHRTEVDWMYLWDLALRKGRIGYIKYVLKSSLMKLPVFGWSFQLLEFISVERKWEIDESSMHRMLQTFKDPRDPSGSLEQKCEGSQKYAAENGLPILKNVLLPKTKGFYACLQELRASLDSVYDVTIGYKYRCPSFMDNAFGVDPAEVHVHVRRVHLDDIPMSENEVTSWLMDTFHFKDQLLSDFHSKGHFPNPGTEKELSTVKCLLNAIGVIFLTCTCTYLTFFSSIWFKVYVSSVCAYLASATYFNIRPQPIAGYGKAVITRNSAKH